jgi:hypothetical protein
MSVIGAFYDRGKPPLSLIAVFAVTDICQPAFFAFCKYPCGAWIERPFGHRLGHGAHEIVQSFAELKTAGE